MYTSDRLRRAATILKSIPDTQADAILERLPTRDLRSLIRALRELDAVAEGQLFEALELFARDASALANRPAPVERKMSVEQMMGSDPLVEQPTRAYFRFLLDCSVSQVAALLDDEHPRHAAMVLTHLPSDFASDVLSCLDPIVRVSTLKRICDADQASDQELNALNIALHKRATKARNVTEPASALEFEDLVRLTDREWQTLLHYVDTSCWAPAFKTAPRGLRERLLANLATEPKRLLLKEIESLQDLDPSRIRESRECIVDACRTLLEAGRIEFRQL